MFRCLCRNRCKRKNKKISSRNDRNVTRDADKEVYHVLECNGGAEHEGADLYDLVSSSETSQAVTAKKQDTTSANDDVDIYDSVGNDDGKGHERECAATEEGAGGGGGGGGGGTDEDGIEMVYNTAYESYELGLLQSMKMGQFMYDPAQQTSKSSKTMGPKRKLPLYPPDLKSKQMMSQTMPRMPLDMSQLATSAASKAKELYSRRKTSPGSSVRSRHSVDLRSASETVTGINSLRSVEVTNDSVFESPKRSKCNEQLSGNGSVTSSKAIQLDIQRDVLEHLLHDINEKLDDRKETDEENSVHAGEADFESGESEGDQNDSYEFVTAKLQSEIKQALCKRTSVKVVNERPVGKTDESTADSTYSNERQSFTRTSKYLPNYENVFLGDGNSESKEEKDKTEEEEKEEEMKQKMEEQKEMNSSDVTQLQIENAAIKNVEQSPADKGSSNDENATKENFVFFTEQSFSKIEEDVVVHETLSKGEVKYAPLTLFSRKRQVRRFSL